MWSILRHFHLEGVHDPQRLTDLKQYENTLNFKNIPYVAGTIYTPGWRETR